ncbi:MAG TPA: SLC13 family permease [Stellaceae bacterium]|nr:SLC13 family permease [Stellaceae bacterium]
MGCHARPVSDRAAHRDCPSLRNPLGLSGERHRLPGLDAARPRPRDSSAAQPGPLPAAIAMASNIGSTATITDNPQNIIIGSLSHIPYGTFAAALSPIAGIGLVLTAVLIALAYRSEFWTCQWLPGEHQAAHANWPIIVKSVVVTLAMVLGFFAGFPPAEVAIVAGAILLLTRRIKSEKVYAEIDWTLLLMFAGLFIVVTGLERSALSPAVIGAVGQLHLERVPVLSVITAILSNVVSNVPAVLVLKPFIARNGFDPHRQLCAGWLGGQSDRGAVGTGAKCRNRVLGVLQGRRAADGADNRYRRAENSRENIAGRLAQGLGGAPSEKFGCVERGEPLSLTR